jgi:hypothetical protein
MICTQFHHPQTNTFCSAHNIRGTIFFQYSTKPLAKNTSKPWPKKKKRAGIELQTAKVPLAYIKRLFFIIPVLLSFSITVFSVDRQCLDAATVAGRSYQ